MFEIILHGNDQPIFLLPAPGIRRNYLPRCSQLQAEQILQTEKFVSCTDDKNFASFKQMDMNW